MFICIISLLSSIHLIAFLISLPHSPSGSRSTSKVFFAVKLGYSRLSKFAYDVGSIHAGEGGESSGSESDRGVAVPERACAQDIRWTASMLGSSGSDKRSGEKGRAIKNRSNDVRNSCSNVSSINPPSNQVCVRYAPPMPYMHLRRAR